jgi:[protein-PII] uridylyltransferase
MGLFVYGRPKPGRMFRAILSRRDSPGTRVMPDTIPPAPPRSSTAPTEGTSRRSDGTRQPPIPGRTSIAKRLNALAEAHDGSIDRLRGPLLSLLKEILAEGRAAIRSRFEASHRGDDCVHQTAKLTDGIVQALADFTLDHVYPTAELTKGERLAIVAIGGYGRAEMAPFSDVDLLFLLPYKRTPRVEQVVEYMLYLLWDLGWKVGHAVRSVDECIRLSLDDMTIRTSLLEARFLWGEKTLFDELRRRFTKDVVAASGSVTAFIEAKMGERNERHRKVGDSRYMLEPNIKEGKGRASRPADLVLDRQIRLSGGRGGGVGRQGRADAGGGAAFRQGRELPVGRPLPTALPDGPSGRSPDLRPADGDVAASGLYRTCRQERG